MTANSNGDGLVCCREDEGGGGEADDGQRQLVDIFIRHVDQQRQHGLKCEPRPSIPSDSIELATLSGVVMRRKQQLQTRFLQQERTSPKQLLVESATSQQPRPLSISSISSAVSSGSSSSGQSSSSLSSSGHNFTRQGSLNYGFQERKRAYLASIESLSSSRRTSSTGGDMPIEAALKNLSLSPGGQLRDAAARAAVLEAGAQSRGFGPPGGRASRINRSIHSSLRYDKNTAYRIHLLANARALRNGGGVHTNEQSSAGASVASTDDEVLRRGCTVSRNNSSTSSDSDHHRLAVTRGVPPTSRACQCMTNPLISATRQLDQAAASNSEEAPNSNHNESGSSYLTSRRHRAECPLSAAASRRRRASAKLHLSPSSASSLSNASSSFRDDGFEDDLTSSASERLSSRGPLTRRLSFQERADHCRSYYSCRLGEMDDDEYQSCEEDFANSHTTASTTSNPDDCGLSTTSSSIMAHEQLILDAESLAKAKQQYRKSLMLEHQQNQQLLQQTQLSGQSKIQSLLSLSPKLCHLGPASLAAGANSKSSSPTLGCSPTRPSSTSATKQAKCDDRTVNIIGHMPTRSPGYWDSNLSISQRVVTEIIETERAYVEDLEQIVTGYICYLRNVLKQQQRQRSRELKATKKRAKRQAVSQEEMVTSGTEVSEEESEPTPTSCSSSSSSSSEGAIMTAGEIGRLFSNLEDIYKFNKDLLFRLEECYLNPSSVAECFVENAAGFEVYTHYCTVYPQVVSTLTELMNNPSSAQLLEERRMELNQSLPLGSYLLKPVQRILKYHILFQSLIRHTGDDETLEAKDRQLIEEAFSVMTNIACHINSMKKRHENAIRVQEVQGLLSGWEGPDLTTLGELILEDTFKLYNKSRSYRHLLLFDNVLLMTKKKRDGSLCYKGHIACSNFMLIENIKGQPLVFNTVPFDNPKALCSFQAKNLEKKRDWCLQMKEVIFKSFEVKIPEHVRDILMSLTPNGAASATELKSTEKSKAIRAPNYLDRKRMKHDKKK